MTGDGSSARQDRATIAVYGASGHTGRFVVAELRRRGFTPVAVARDEAKLTGAGFLKQGVETRVAGIEEPEALDAALADVAAVINTAGPFLDTAESVAGAALRARVHYLDVTAEQQSALTVFTEFDNAAREAGVALVPAMSFYGGLADLLVTSAASGQTSLDEVRIGIDLDSWYPTVGTRITGQRNTTQRLVVIDGQLAPLSQPAPETTWDFPEPFGRQDVLELPFSEVVLITRHLRTTSLRSFISQRSLRDLRDPSTPPPTAVDERGRSAQTFVVEAIVRAGDESRRAIAHGVDIYAVTAPLVCEAVERILDGAIPPGGAFAPGQLFDADDFLRALSPHHLTFEPAVL